MTYTAELESHELECLSEDKFFVQAWLKYADKVADKEDVLDYIVEKKIGAGFASTYSQIAKYLEQG